MSLLEGSNKILAERYDVALLDLDGVVYIGPDAVPAAPDALAQARAAGMRLAFVTNNAARPAAAVAAHLSDLGVAADVDEVITSAQVAAHFLSRELPAGANVLVVGTLGLIEALRERGLTPVFSADDEPAAVVQGYSPELTWAQLAEGAVAIRRGVRWVATNLDATVPSARGPVPGNGSMVAALRHATGIEPVSTGKPDPTMHAETVERSRAQRPLVVGDRLDTDIEGARRVGCDSLLVFSGVTDPAALLAARPGQRPDYLADDVAGIMSAHPAVTAQAQHMTCRRWQVTVASGALRLITAPAGPTGAGDAGDAGDAIGAGGPRADHLDALRALCWAAWTSGIVGVRAGDDASAQAVSDLGLRG